jgi:hypothetical protein
MDVVSFPLLVLAAYRASRGDRNAATVGGACSRLACIDPNCPRRQEDETPARRFPQIHAISLALIFVMTYTFHRGCDR